MKKWFAVLAVVVLALVISGVAMAQDAPSGELEIFSWWTGGGEAAGLDALIARFAEMYPDVTVVNAAVAGGSGVNARAVLTTRMLGGDPPDTFQVHAGEELNAVWVAANAVEPLNSIYEANGWMEQFPAGLLDLLTDAEGNIYAVPVNIHRSNVLWYIPANLEQWGVTVPASWDEFVNTTCPALQAAGVTPLAVGEAWTQTHLWESVALGVLGAEAYNGLWNGATSWTSPEVQNVFTTFQQVIACTNDDRNALTWQDASKMVTDGTAAFNIMGDWAAGYFFELGLAPSTDFAWAASPGTEGNFMMLSDSFALPVGAPNPAATNAWLSFVGTAEAQDLFNPVKGSLPANTTAEIGNAELYNAYFQDAYQDWTSNAIVGSLQHGLVAPPAFLNGFGTALQSFLSSGDVASTTAALGELALQTGMTGN